MDMLEDALQHGSKEEPDDQSVVLSDDTSAEEALAGVSQGTLTLDPSMQYQFRADTSGGQVTYRVVQVGPDGSPGEAQVVGTNFPPGVAQAVLAQNPFSNGGSPTPEVMTQDGRFAYVQAGAVAQDAGAQEALAAIGQVTTATDGNGQFYVMMSPQDVLQGQRTIAPRTHNIDGGRIEGARGGRDERRRATHNEVERRRRDKINNWIVQLSKLVPDCAQECNKAGQVTGVLSVGSKGGILSKACEYITSLRTANSRMGESLKDLEKLSVDVELLRQQCDELKQENTLLRSTMQQHGLMPPDTANSSNS